MSDPSEICLTCGDSSGVHEIAYPGGPYCEACRVWGRPMWHAFTLAPAPSEPTEKGND